jgi:hypothetical protein
MTSTEHRGPDADHAVPDVRQVLSLVNSVLSLSLILAQASSPAQAMRLVTTAIPSIVADRSAVAWHPSRAGEYYERAPEYAAELLAGLTGVARLTVEGFPASWAFPVASPLTGGDQVFLVVSGPVDLSEQEVFLLSVLAQLCGTVIASQELISTLAKRMDIRSLTRIVPSGGQAGIAATLHQLTGYPVLIVDLQGNPSAVAGQGPGDHRLLNRDPVHADARWAERSATTGSAARGPGRTPAG